MAYTLPRTATDVKDEHTNNSNKGRAREQPLAVRCVFLKDHIYLLNSFIYIAPTESCLKALYIVS